jgi:hypothetical protein
MTASETPTKLVRMLAAVEQDVKQAEMLANCTALNFEARQWAAEQFEYWQRAATRVEKMLRRRMSSRKRCH